MKAIHLPPFFFKSTLSVLLFFGLLAPVFSQTTYTFSTAGNWTTAANWSGGTMPPEPLPTGDFIVIDANCTLDEARTIQGTLTVNPARTLTIYHASNNFIFSDNGTINNSGTIAITEQFNHNSGGVFTNMSGGTVTLSSVGHLYNFGTFMNNSGATISFPSTGAITNENGGMITNNGSISYGSVWTNKAGSTMNNNSAFFITNGFATFNNQAGAILNLNTGSNMNTQCNLNNNGTLNLNSGGILKLLQDPAIMPAGTFNWAGTLAINANMYILNGQTFTIPNGAIFELDNFLSYLLVYNGGTLINNGTMTLKGRLDNAGTTTGTGVFNLNTTNGEIYNSSGGAFTCNGTMTINSTGLNAGFRNFAGSTLTNNGTINNNGYFINSGTFSNVGTFNLNTGGTLDLNANPAVLPGGTFNWNSGMLRVATNGVMTLSNTLTVPAGCTLSATSTAAFTVSASGQLLVNGFAYFHAPLVNNGIVTNSNTLNIYAASSMTNNGTLSNSSALLFQKTFTNIGIFNQTVGNVDFCYSNAAFPVGTFNWTGGTLNIGNPNYNGTMTLTYPITVPANTVFKATNWGLLTNSSTITIQSGGKLETKVDNFLNNATIINNGIFSTFSGSTFYTGGTLKGVGVYQGSQYYNELSGNVAPGASPGCHSFANGFANQATLSIEINGLTACTEYDRVQVTGSMVRGGTLAINFGFTPTVGQTFQIFTASSFSGSFASITVSPATITVSLTNGLLTVTAVSAPPNCTSLTTPANGATNVAVTAALTWTAASGSPTGYRLDVGTTPGGTDILNNFDVGNVTTYNPPGDFPFGTTIYVKIKPYNGTGSVTGCPEEGFTTACQLFTYYADGDNDTYGNLATTTQACSAPAGYVANSTDCNDNDAAIHPGAPEICNGVDDDCSGNPEATINTWNGNGDALNWSNPTNWSDGIVPLPCQDVAIPPSFTVNVAAGIHAVGKTLDVPASAQLTVESTATVTIQN